MTKIFFFFDQYKSTLIIASIFLYLSSLFTLAKSHEQTPQTNLPQFNLFVDVHQITVQLASTPLQLQKGLMYRKIMPQNEGMLFAFKHKQIQCFWMKNTILPLTIAFVQDSGHIVNLADMQPYSTQTYCSLRPVRFALEMHQGWFNKRKIQAGARLHGAPFNVSNSLFEN